MKVELITRVYSNAFEAVQAPFSTSSDPIHPCIKVFTAKTVAVN